MELPGRGLRSVDGACAVRGGAWGGAWGGAGWRAEWRGAAPSQLPASGKCAPPPSPCPSLWALEREWMDIARGQLTCPAAWSCGARRAGGRPH